MFPSGIILKCIIKKTGSILNLVCPDFDLYLANGLKHVLAPKYILWEIVNNSSFQW